MDPRIKNLLERLDKDGIVITKQCDMAAHLGRMKEIRKLRKNGELFIGKDRKKGVTLIYKKKLPF